MISPQLLMLRRRRSSRTSLLQSLQRNLAGTPSRLKGLSEDKAHIMAGGGSPGSATTGGAARLTVHGGFSTAHTRLSRSTFSSEPARERWCAAIASFDQQPFSHLEPWVAGGLPGCSKNVSNTLNC